MSCCNTTFTQLGAPNCKFNFGAIKYIMFVDYDYIVASEDLTPNLSTIISNSAGVLSSKLYEVDTTKPESIFQEFADGTKFYLRDAIRPLTATLPKATPAQLNAYKKLRCKRNLAMYLIDGNGYLLGWNPYVHTTDNEVTQKVLPIPIPSESIDPLFQFATDSTVQQIVLTLQFEQTFDDSLLVAANPQYNVNEFQLAPVFMSNLTADLTNSVVTCRLFSPAGTIGNLVLNDFDFTTPVRFTGRNKTTGLEFEIICDAVTYDTNTEVLTFEIQTINNAVLTDYLLFQGIVGAKKPYGLSDGNPTPMANELLTQLV